MPVPFAESGTKNTVPIPSQIGITPGAASFTTGFPPLNFTPILAGGVAPFGADFNGVFNAITQALRWSNAGGQYVYDATFATAIGGYPKGALVQRSTLDGFWLSTADNNATDPDASGAGWTDPLSGRLINVQTFTASGTYTPTAGTKSVVVEVVGGGGAGGGTATCTASQASAGAGGGGGGYAKSRLTTGFSGATVTIGAGGAGVVSAGGGNGGTSSFGALLSAPGGSGGTAGAVNGLFPSIAGNGPGGSVGVGGNILNAMGSAGGSGFMNTASTAISGVGGASVFGGGGGAFTNTTINGAAASTPGSGGSGALTIASGAGKTGGNGAAGIVIVYEYA